MLLRSKVLKPCMCRKFPVKSGVCVKHLREFALVLKKGAMKCAF